MFQRIRNSRAAEAGFTLVEMVVVVAVIGIIASVAVLAIGGTTDSSKQAACEAEVGTVQTASDAYYAANDAYAASIDALVEADFLRKRPTGTGNYAVTYTAATGVATSPCVAAAD